MELLELVDGKMTILLMIFLMQVKFPKKFSLYLLAAMKREEKLN